MDSEMDAEITALDEQVKKEVTALIRLREEIGQVIIG